MTTIPPLLHTIRREADMIAPTRSHASDGTVGDPAHAQRVSDHNPDARGVVHAIDLTYDPQHGFDSRAEGEALRLRCLAGLERRVKYLVSYDGRTDIIASPVAGWAWRRQRGRDHASHLHISILPGPEVENSTAQMLRPRGLPMTATPPAKVVGGAAAPGGYYLVSNTGSVYAYGPPYHGGWGGMPRNADVCALVPYVANGSAQGYWLVARDGGVLTFGAAPYFGSLGGQPLAAPIVGAAGTPTGGGYWLFGADGGVFAFGDAPYLGRPDLVV